ncbi:Thioesterase superfamily [Penicillium malachiteum]|uniref:Thioesterase superfamily n=1 Tax=Penicillium malachiteum TaxID=1324776 RepID=A0AAD6MXR5_9EURO|nr:Thioesterase superfamily [Penicillium malachiteum]
MPDHKVLLPERELTDFEQHAYECTYLIGRGAGDVVRTPYIYTLNALDLLQFTNTCTLLQRWDIDAEDCSLRFESASQGPPAKVSFTFTVTRPLCNTLGSLHGGCAATLVDILSTTILMGVSRPGRFGFGGVSRNLRLTYLRPVPLGSEARVMCEVMHVGKRLALLRAEIQKADTGDICVVAEHEKANTDPEVDQKI